jgi:release factor glutamine methyltransferase
VSGNEKQGTPPTASRSASAEPWTIGRLLRWTTEFFAQKGFDTPRLDAEVLLAEALGCERIDLYVRYDEPVGEAGRAPFREFVRRRARHEPVAYIVGHKEFFSLDFLVSRDVMIPRPDSEFVVLEFLKHCRSSANPLVVDVGTGSGNLAVTIAHQHLGARVVATDISMKALRVAQQNAACHGVRDRVLLVRADLLSWARPEPCVDVIVSNPPYIPTGELSQLPPGVRDYEPIEALNGGPTGLDVVRRLVAQSASVLKPGGYLILEIGAPQELSVRELLLEVGGFEVLPTVRDYAGHPRVVVARRIIPPRSD